MAIENRNLEPGTKLVAKYKGQQFECVFAGGVFMVGTQEFKSPSSAGSAVMGGHACNGWRFWSIAGEDGKAPAAKAERKAKGSKIIKCGDCGKAYMTAEQLAHHTANAERLCKPHQGNGQAAQEAEAEAVA